MKANPLAGNYQYLTPEERFRLIMAASRRGDDAERERLIQTGSRLTLLIADHAPHMLAFGELHLAIFLELLEVAADYMQARACIDEAGDATERQADKSGAADSADDHAGDWLAQKQSLDLALVVGYVLRTKADGWRRFCEQMQVPPFLLWEKLPGFSRLKRALALAEETAFTPEELLRCLNDHRPAAVPELTEVPLTAAAVAAENEETFRRSVRWWSG